MSSHVAMRGGVETEMRRSVNEGCNMLGALKGVMGCRTMGMEAKRGLYEEVVLPTMTNDQNISAIRALFNEDLMRNLEAMFWINGPGSTTNQHTSYWRSKR